MFLSSSLTRQDKDMCVWGVRVCECVWVCMCPCVLGALGAETPTKRGFYIMSSLQSYKLRSLITTSSLLSVGFTNHMSTLQYRQSVELLAVDSINQSTIHTITVDPTNRRLFLASSLCVTPVDSTRCRLY